MKSSLWTLIGLVVTLYVAATGSQVLTDTYSGLTDMVKLTAAATEVESIHKVLFSYFIEFDDYPRSFSRLRAHFDANYSEPLETVGLDPWGNSFRVVLPEWEVLCAGPDLRYESGDDIFSLYPSTFAPGLVNGGDGFWLASPYGTRPDVESDPTITVTSETISELRAIVDLLFGPLTDEQFDPFVESLSDEQIIDLVDGYYEGMTPDDYVLLMNQVLGVSELTAPTP